MSALGRMIPHAACTWCGHGKHVTKCPVTIQTGTAKNPDVIGCPCAYRAGKQRAVLGGLANLLTSAGDTVGGAE